MEKHTDISTHLETNMDHAIAEEITEDIAVYRTLVSNVYMLGNPSEKNWVLIDTGIAHYHGRIISAAKKRFNDTPPKAIILTHAHFDHVGSAKKLAKHWDVSIYVHPEELPFVDGTCEYPPADPTVGGGLLSLLSPVFPTDAVNLKHLAKTLSADGKLPFLDDWHYIHTPGHTPGHISLFRESDKILIAGDAVTTENPESSLAVLLPIIKLYGPPAYFTHDWDDAERSVQTLAKLKPKLLLTGHGLPMKDKELSEGFEKLTADFYDIAIPKHKRN
ncbi:MULTISPECIES: MBL fold metallo-hydrolase [Paraliobacillus]|uniref:MBL fold metallo-hydrolase n=1 Tax=Paraliobacillus TaxID=200903 RepID=UPI000DD492BB|nr:MULTISPECIES: MBL fold metallo-hydrolase [Paraliobacillus]